MHCVCGPLMSTSAASLACFSASTALACVFTHLSHSDAVLFGLRSLTLYCGSGGSAGVSGGGDGG